MWSERVEWGSMETLSDGQENPLTYELMLSELCVISVGVKRRTMHVCEPQTQFSQGGRIILFQILYKPRCYCQKINYDSNIKFFVTIVDHFTRFWQKTTDRNVTKNYLCYTESLVNAIWLNSSKEAPYLRQVGLSSTPLETWGGAQTMDDQDLHGFMASFMNWVALALVLYNIWNNLEIN